MEQTAASSALHSRLKIFVGGAPAQVETSVLIYYFSKFGKIISVIPFNSAQRSRNQQQVGKGCFILHVGNKETYQAVLAYDHHSLCGRRLQCQPYLRGKKLVAENLERNQRRLILKFVPKEIKERELKHFLELNFGEVEYIFAFKPESKSLTSQFHSKKFRTYSIMFKSITHAQALANQGQLVFRDWPPITVERYKRKSAAPQDPAILHQPNLDTHLIIPEVPYKIPKSKSTPFLQANDFLSSTPHIPLLEPPRRRSIGGLGQVIADPQQLCDLLLMIYQDAHYKKPGSKGYAWTHGFLYDYITRFSDFNRAEQLTCFRLNIAHNR